MNEQFAAWLATKLGAEGPVEITDLHRHTEGFSWQTYTFTARWHTGRVPYHAGFAVRREPEDGLLSPYDIRAQYELHRAVAERSRVPVPALRWLETDPSVLGMPFYVMDRVDGRVPVQWTPEDPQVFPTPQARRHIGEQFVDHLAEIHACPTAGLPVPAATDPAKAGRHAVDRWEDAYRSAAHPRIPLVELAADWARENEVTSGRLALCHGDYRIGNFMLDRQGLIVAVLDWELAEISDPVADVAWAALALFRGRSPLWSHLITEEDFLRRYRERTGLVIEPDVLRFWTIVNYIKVVSSYARAARAFRDGRTADLRLAAMGHQVFYVLRLLRRELRSVGAMP